MKHGKSHSKTAAQCPLLTLSETFVVLYKKQRNATAVTNG